MIIHTRKDATLIQTVQAPAAGSAAMTGVIDLLQPGGLDNMVLAVEYPALPALVDQKKITLTIQASELKDDWKNPVTVFTDVITGTTTGAEARTIPLRVPTDCPQFVRLSVAVATGAGDNTAAAFELSVRV